MAEKKKDLRKALATSGLLTAEQVKIATDEGRKTGEGLIRIILNRKMLEEKQVLAFLEEEMGIPHVSLSSYLIDQKMIDLLPPAIARKFGVIPLFSVENTISMAMIDPFDIKAIDEVRTNTKCGVEVFAATPTEINQAISQYYGVSGTIEEVISAEEKTSEKAAVMVGKTQILVGMEEAPITKLINLLLVQAIQQRASDVHIEPEEKRTRVRYRIDGIMHEVSATPTHLQSPMVSRIKVMGRMDIAETRVPQDGRIEFKYENRSIDVRVSTFPTIHGEAVVMRLLDKQSMVFSLSDIGFSDENLKKFEALAKRPYGIIMVTGPTGSGKTTTLYATLQHILSPERNIVTVEDPVEYEMAGIRQSQVNVKAGLVFATALRSILRQDPDVILVGEIRDFETASVAIEAALTGHLVFSTLHTNDAPGSLTRLEDMGVEPFLISSATAGVIAQRLVRKICQNCKAEVQVPEEIVNQFETLKGKNYKFYHGKGCMACGGTGYRGRTGIFELLVMTDEIRNLVMSKTQTGKIRDSAIAGGMRVLREDGIQKVIAGITTIDEVMRVTQLD
ncbi:MAG: ATPase, T2SS/T4P/T4SS family [Candidatus Margulisiibacteriota bacterium]